MQRNVRCVWYCTAADLPLIDMRSIYLDIGIIQIFCSLVHSIFGGNNANVNNIVTHNTLMSVLIRVGHGLDPSMDWIGLDWIL